MTELLEKAFSEAAKLSQEDQDALAQWILQELTAERRWQDAYADSGDALDALAGEALAELQAGHIEELDLNQFGYDPTLPHHL